MRYFVYFSICRIFNKILRASFYLLFVFPDSSISFSFFLLALMLLQTFLTISLALLSPSRSLIFTLFLLSILTLTLGQFSLFPLHHYILSLLILFYLFLSSLLHFPLKSIFFFLHYFHFSNPYIFIFLYFIAL